MGPKSAWTMFWNFTRSRKSVAVAFDRPGFA
jgi:hypothetical protein